VRAWQADLARTASSLAAVLGCDPAGTDLDVALTARAAVLDHVAVVLADLAPRTRTRPGLRIGRNVPIAALENDPLAALAAILHGRCNPRLDRPPSQLLDPAYALTEPTRRWVATGLHALLAGREWSDTETIGLDGEAAWRAVGGVAALARGIAALDADLRALAPPGHEAIPVLAATAGLHRAAREALTLATRGNPGHPADIEPPAGVTVAGRPTSITAALAERAGPRPGIAQDLRRLSLLLDRTPELTPNHIRAGARVAHGLCVLAAPTAIGRDAADLRPELDDLARHLQAAAGAGRGEFPINPNRAAAVEVQLRDLHVTTKLALATRTELDPGEATGVARRLPRLVDQLAEHTRRAVEDGRWAMPDRSEDAVLPYAITSTTNPAHTPPLLGHLDTARTVAAGLLGRATDPDPAAPALAAAIRTLDTAAGRPAPDRPEHPAARPTRSTRTTPPGMAR
jgi:hypothetical protein